MVIHLTSSRSCVAKNITNLRKTIEIIHKTGNVLARDWIEPQYYILHHGLADLDDAETVYNAHIDAIERADLVIIDATYGGFGAGFQVSQALQKKKPTLLLIQAGYAEGNFSLGVRDVYLTKKVYDETNLGGAVTDFIKDNIVRTKDLRFNFVMDRMINNHLRLQSYKTGRTKAEVLRDLLVKDIQEWGDSEQD